MQIELYIEKTITRPASPLNPRASVQVIRESLGFQASKTTVKCHPVEGNLRNRVAVQKPLLHAANKSERSCLLTIAKLGHWRTGGG